MTQSLARGGPGLGAVFGPGNMEKLAKAAGFGHFEIVDIPNPTNLFFVLRP